MKLSVEEFQQIQYLLKQNSGIALPDTKGYLIKSRLEQIVVKYGMKSFGEIALRFREPGQGLFRDEVIEALVTNETSFNRDHHPFDELLRSILPVLANRMIERRNTGLPFPKLRIWSAAASTGQEPYSIAMAILEFLEANPKLKLTPEQFSILASDISERALSVAKKGAYNSLEMERGLTDRLQEKFFIKLDSLWQLQQRVRQMVEFRKINLVQSTSDLVGFDLVFCRNLMIYFEEQTRVDVVQRLARSLNPDGMLIIGAAEQLPAIGDELFTQRKLGDTIVFVRKNDGLMR